MERDGFACTCCQDSESMLNVHHKYYVWGKMPWEYPGEALTTLCGPCHEAESWAQADFKQNIHQLLQDGYTYEHLNQYISGLQGNTPDMDLVRIAAFCAQSSDVLNYAKERIDSNWNAFIESIPEQ